MELKSFGCSFIYGTDLSDITDSAKHSHLTWPSLLANKFGMSYRCLAGGGHGNLSILDRLLLLISEDPQSLFVIQWTYVDRLDYSDRNGRHFNKGTNDWTTILPGTNSLQSEFFFREIHSEYRDKLTSLIYVKTALDALRENNCKFIMTCIDKTILCDQYHTSTYMRQWQQDIKTNLIFFEGQDFLQWSNRKGFPIGKTNHPLEEAHAAAAELMIPVIDAILHKV